MELVISITEYVIRAYLHSCRLGKQLAGHQRMSKQFPDTFFLIPHLPTHLLWVSLSDCSNVLFGEVLIIARVLTYFSSKCQSHRASPWCQGSAVAQTVGYSKMRVSALANFLWFWLALFICVQGQRKLRVGRGKRRREEQKRATSWKHWHILFQLGTALCYVWITGRMFLSTPLRLTRCSNSKETGAQTPPPVNSWKMNSMATSLHDLCLMEAVILLWL